MADALSADARSILQRLKPGETPIFRYTKQAILALRPRADSLSAKELARLVLADPLATLRIVYQSNNRTQRSLGGEIATVEHAVLMQGIGPFFNEIATLPVFEDSMAGRSAATQASLYRLLRIAQHAAWQARDFVVQSADTRAEEVEVAALLYYVPDLLFWLQAPDVARQLARARRGMSYAKAEESVLGQPLGQLRLDMLQAWKVPEVIQGLLDPELIERPRQGVLWAALNIAHRGRHGWWQEKLQESYDELARVLGVPTAHVVANAHINAIKVARYGRWIPSPPAAAWLPMLAGEWPPEPEDEEAEPPRADTRTPTPDTGPVRTEAAAPAATDNAVFRETLSNIQAHADGSYTLNQMSAQILRGLHTGLGLSRILFAMVTPDGRRIKIRFSLGIPAGDPLRHFEFELGAKDLFGQLMSKPQGIWMQPDNRDRLWPMVAPALRDMIGVADFFAMSLYDGRRPSGLIYADRGHAGSGLDAHAYTDFKMFCLQAARGLARLKS